jgi:hypothetical protein
MFAVLVLVLDSWASAAGFTVFLGATAGLNAVGRQLWCDATVTAAMPDAVLRFVYFWVRGLAFALGQSSCLTNKAASLLLARATRSYSSAIRAAEAAAQVTAQEAEEQVGQFVPALVPERIPERIAAAVPPAARSPTSSPDADADTDTDTDTDTNGDTPSTSPVSTPAMP